MNEVDQGKPFKLLMFIYFFCISQNSPVLFFKVFFKICNKMFLKDVFCWKINAEALYLFTCEMRKNETKLLLFWSVNARFCHNLEKLFILLLNANLILFCPLTFMLIVRERKKYKNVVKK